MENTDRSYTTARKTFWTVAAFYFLIGFEFVYMATPFAMYFYSVYRPGLGFIGDSPLFAWLGTFFLPHLAVDTTSASLNFRNEIGIALAVIGFCGFCFGVIQVYYHKLARKGAVTGGVYNFIRHPQYASLILCSFGLMVLWPRYLVLLSFIAMLFVYYFLARLEEKECEEKFGGSYVEYKNRTGMFFPVRVPRSAGFSVLPKNGVKRIMAILGLYIVISTIALVGAHFLKTWSVEKIYGYYENDAAWVSVTRMSDGSLGKIVRTVLSDSVFQNELSGYDGGKGKFVNYIMPVGYYALEIPQLPEKAEVFHFIKRQFTDGAVKVVFTRVDGVSRNAEGRTILLNAVRKTPLLEVWVDTRSGKITNAASLVDRPELIARMPGPMF